MFLKSVFELTPKPLPAHSLITNDDIALQSARTLDLSSQVHTTISSNFDQLNENHPSRTDDSPINLLEDFN